jgi:hypothetical protein
MITFVVYKKPVLVALGVGKTRLMSRRSAGGLPW